MPVTTDNRLVVLTPLNERFVIPAVTRLSVCVLVFSVTLVVLLFTSEPSKLTAGFVTVMLNGPPLGPLTETRPAKAGMVLKFDATVPADVPLVPVVIVREAWRSPH